MGESKNEGQKSQLREKADVLLLGLVSLSLLLIALNLFYVMNLSSAVQGQSMQISALQATGSAAGGAAKTGLSQDEIIAQVTAEVIPKGKPAVYGDELTVSFDSVQGSINKLAAFDNAISLQGAEQQRYISVGTAISCEYCCGAKYITTPEGNAACGCDHSAAMRGLAKYLIKNHGSRYSNEQILAELAKWKATFFPKQTIQKAVQLKAQRGEINPSALTTLPDMVGGC